jgi:hypothetical protein
MGVTDEIFYLRSIGIAYFRLLQHANASKPDHAGLCLIG